MMDQEQGGTMSDDITTRLGALFAGAAMALATIIVMLWIAEGSPR